MQPASIYLRSYDYYNEILRYDPPTGTHAIITRADFEALGVKPHFGWFVREEAVVVGIYGSPEGPVFFFNSRRIPARLGRTTAQVEEVGPSRLRFTLFNDGAALEDSRIAIEYQERLGLGANPYDNEPEDIDLFAWIARGLSSSAFYQLCTREWGRSEVV